MSADIAKTAPLPGDMPEDFTLEDLKESVTEDELAAFEANAGEIDFAPAADAAAQPAATEPAVQQPAAQDQAALADVPDVSAAQAIVDKLEADIDELASKYDDGELTKAEWLEQQKALVAEQARAQTQISQAQQIIAQNTQTVQQRWFGGLEAYKAAGNEALWSDEHVGGWDAALRSVSGNAQYNKLPFEKQFELAHDMYAAHYRATTGKALQTNAGAKADGEIKVAIEPLKAKTEPREDTPRTLAGMNGDLSNSLTDGTLASIMASDPERAEALLSKLSEADFERMAEAV